MKCSKFLKLKKKSLNTRNRPNEYRMIKELPCVILLYVFNYSSNLKFMFPITIISSETFFELGVTLKVSNNRTI